MIKQLPNLDVANIKNLKNDQHNCWDRFQLTGEIIVIHSVPMLGTPNQYSSHTYALKQVDGKWVWLLGVITSISSIDAFDDENIDDENYGRFDTFEDCFRHFYTWYNTPKL